MGLFQGRESERGDAPVSHRLKGTEIQQCPSWNTIYLHRTVLGPSSQLTCTNSNKKRVCGSRVTASAAVSFRKLASNSSTPSQNAPKRTYLCPLKVMHSGLLCCEANTPAGSALQWLETIPRSLSCWPTCNGSCICRILVEGNSGASPCEATSHINTPKWPNSTYIFWGVGTGA